MWQWRMREKKYCVDAVGPNASHITRVITETVFILSITLLLFGKRLKPYTMPCIFAAYALEEMYVHARWCDTEQHHILCPRSIVASATPISITTKIFKRDVTHTSSWKKGMHTLSAVNNVWHRAFEFDWTMNMHYTNILTAEGKKDTIVHVLILSLLK